MIRLTEIIKGDKAENFQKVLDDVIDNTFGYTDGPFTFTSVDYDTFTFGFLITFNLLSIIILVVYVLSIRSMNGEETEQSEETSEDGKQRI